MSKSGKFLLGALLGAAAAVLLTPVAGKKARGSLKKMAVKQGLPLEAIEAKAEELLAKGKEAAASALPKKPVAPKKTKTKK